MSYFSQVEFHAKDREQLKQLNQLRAQPYQQHQALWQLFDNSNNAKQPFVFRDISSAEDSALRILMVSAQPPESAHPLWQVRSKRFAPQFEVGEVFSFRLRMNPTRTVKPAGASLQSRGKRQDWVMANLHATPTAQRAEARQLLIHEGLPQWLTERSERFGFAIKKVQVLSFETQHCKTKTANVSLGVAEFDGILEVRDVALLQASLTQGIGHGKGFGLGLLIVKR